MNIMDKFFEVIGAVTLLLVFAWCGAVFAKGLWIIIKRGWNFL